MRGKRLVTAVPVDAIREKAEARVNTFYSALAVADAQRDIEHAENRTAAAAAVKPDWFVEKAAIENMTPDDLAAAILSKPNVAAERGNQRRAAIVALRLASTAGQIEEILAPYEKATEYHGS